MSAPAGPNENNEVEEGFDFVIVGSGAGGGPLAANLAEAGMRVLLLEAGDANENDDYRVPGFHGRATEDPNFSWKYFVQHYQDPQQAKRDSKYVEPGQDRDHPEREGIFYPRAGTLGGCTAHHALTTVYPHNSDFDNIAECTGDRSWRSDVMRSYFERMEHFRLPRLLSSGLLSKLSSSLPSVADPIVNPGRHGFRGWLPTTFGDPELVIRDSQLLEVVLAAAEESLVDFLQRPLRPLEGLGSLVDPNDWRVATQRLQGLFLVPMSTTGEGQRSGARERVLEVQRRVPDKLVVRTGALVTRVVLDETGTARGVDYIDQPHVYRADPRRATDGPLPRARRVLVRHEVVLAAGSFNTPQLLKLSGIGPRAELEQHGIVVAVDLPGVGENLQDRYEVGVVSEIDEDFALIKECTFLPPEPGKEPDPCFQEFQDGAGVYTTNGAVVCIILKSQRDLTEPDLFIFGLPADFRGYEPGYSQKLELNRNRFTWTILKAHTANKRGQVLLRSADPRDTPDINFHYFAEGTDKEGQDLEAVVKGIEFARAINHRAKRVVRKELSPGLHVQSRERLRTFVQDQAWGHHASGTCKIGPADDANAVVDSRFRVHGVRGLRVVDASVFPRIPGFFIVTPTYMISEKASDVILDDTRAARRPGNGAARVRSVAEEVDVDVTTEGRLSAMEAESYGNHVDLILEGGGAKGLATAGAVIRLLEGGYTFPRVAGTSAGAIMAALVAAIGKAGGGVDTLKEVVGRLKPSKVPDSAAPHVPLLSEGFSLFKNNGLFEGDYIRDWLHCELKKLGVETFGDLRRDDPEDDAELADEQRYSLVVMATDVT
ncbi:MAG: GMC family oxidoreductase N-terminal domain-containing protein, partial [Actinobacteria bacterium]|nr:GMC family oxidoreductase N-terminal domain-containing protein [Actinomycetota bacterium]